MRNPRRKRLGPNRKAGPKECPVRTAWEMRFGLYPWLGNNHRLQDSDMLQLSLCQSDEARRLILGISEKGPTGYTGTSSLGLRHLRDRARDYTERNFQRSNK